MIEIIGKDNLENFIWEANQKKKIIVLYFGAEWCGPCKELKRRLESDEAKEEMPDLQLGYIDIDKDENNKISNMYKVKALPTQIFVLLVETQIVEVKRIIGLDWTKFLMNYNELKNNISDI